MGAEQRHDLCVGVEVTDGDDRRQLGAVPAHATHRTHTAPHAERGVPEAATPPVAESRVARRGKATRRACGAVRAATAGVRPRTSRG